ncbi:phosphonopyruvate decarboxylase [Spiractinospora alimapuensis]|uniref:phosphonopyruvate decarboxylase n=1 Tax=Spiractinospora alimapuensis TaxID=2820884 RepID=UPI001EEA20B1|nr:phosphonopyruvate decarboxylase [Spiractinospora alimapuensis]QVQ53030.1 phosphonopyruvate decarboxylase [Spiractinospora alimapuensis]
MIAPKEFTQVCEEQGITLFTGVPDSLLKNLCSHVMAELPRDRHIVAANEGGAVGIAMGHYLRTGKPALVYLQNSGFGNIVNPLLSLADPDVYGVPMLVVIGWRGQPGVKDEPQHVKQGRIMEAALDALEVPWSVLPKDPEDAATAVRRAVSAAVEQGGPSVLLVEKGTFSDAATSQEAPASTLPSREDALIALADAVGDQSAIVSTTGMLSRELFEYRERSGTDGSRDFLTVGGMGHASAIAFGLTTGGDDEVWCFDGDGALLMHLGGLAVIADHAPDRFFHVVFNNGVHDSVGGQPTSMDVVDTAATAKALGYRYAASVSDLAELPDRVAELRAQGGPSLLELRVRPGNRADIGRPTRTPQESREAFMAALGGGASE